MTAQAATAAGTGVPLAPLPLLERGGYPRFAELVAPALAAGDAAQPIALLVPALGMPARLYRPLADALHARGLGVALLELRRVGASPVRAARGCDWGYADLVDGELAHAAATLRAAFPQRPLLAVCHSLGAQLALLLHARHRPIAADGIVLVAAGSPHWRSFGWPARWGIRAAGVAVAATSRACGYFPGHRLGFGGRQPATLMRQWARFLRSGRLGATVDDPAVAARLHADPPAMCALHVAGDALCPPASVARLVRDAGADAAVNAADVDGAPGHFGWMRAPEGIAGQVHVFATALADGAAAQPAAPSAAYPAR